MKEKDFLNWLEPKLGLKKREKVFQKGKQSLLGFVAAYDGFKVLKLHDGEDTYWGTNHLLNKKIKGIAQIYNTGRIIVPKRFQHLFYGYAEIGYLIARKVNQLTSVEKQLIKKVKLAIKKYMFLYSNADFRKKIDYDDIWNLEINTLHHIIMLEPNKRFKELSEYVKANETSNVYKTFLKLTKMFKRMKKSGVAHTDAHEGNFGTDPKTKEFLAFDFSAGADKVKPKYTIKESVAEFIIRKTSLI